MVTHLNYMSSNNFFEKFSVCPLCESSNIIQKYKAKDRHYGILGEYEIDTCNSCKLVFLNPMPTNEYLSSLYPETYYSYQDFFSDKKGISALLSKIFVNLDTKDPKFRQAGKMLDIGCGSGKFIYKMREKGWDVFGVEISKNAADLGRMAANLNIFSGELTHANFPDEYFDYIRLNHSFEHINNPHETLAEIRRILKKDGKLMIGVPNINSLNALIFKQYWYYLGAPVHTFNYSNKTLPLLLEKHGFKNIHVNYNSNYGGLLGSIQIYLNRNSKKITDDGLLFNSKLMRVIAHQTANIFDFFRLGDAIEVYATKQ